MKPRRAQPSASQPKQVFDTGIRWVLLATVLCFCVWIRLRLLDLPLERDEGEYGYAGQLLLQGIPPYKLAYNMKLPGTYGAYALVMAIFGQTAAGIHLGLLVLNLATVFLVYVLGKQLFDAWIGTMAAMCYAFLSVSPGVVGVSTHATHFVIFFALLGIVLLDRAIKQRKWTPLIWSGLMFGLSFLMKQPGAFFGLFGALWLLISELRRKPVAWKESAARLAVFSGFVALPFALTCLFFWQIGLFGKFWFWTFTYAKAYAAVVPRDMIWTVFTSGLEVASAPITFLWCLAPVGLIVALALKQFRSGGLWIGAFLLFSFVAVCPGFYFRQHYFVLLLPAFALCIPMVLQPLRKIPPARLPLPATLLNALVLLGLVGYGVYLQRDFFFKATPLEASRMLYSDNPFIESISIADYIREHSARDAKIAVLGSEPEIFFYAKRRSATGYIYTYGLMEDQPYAKQMQQEMIGEIEAAKPEYMVFVGFPFSWGFRAGADQSIFRWYDQYRLHYETVGMIDYFSAGEEQARFGPDANGARPATKFYVELLHRKQ